MSPTAMHVVHLSSAKHFKRDKLALHNNRLGFGLTCECLQVLLLFDNNSECSSRLQSSCWVCLCS